MMQDETIDGVAVAPGDRVLVKDQTETPDYVARFGKLLRDRITPQTSASSARKGNRQAG